MEKLRPFVAVVDDEYAIRKALKRLLQSAGLAADFRLGARVPAGAARAAAGLRAARCSTWTWHRFSTCATDDMEDEPMNNATRCKKWVSILIGGAMALTMPGALLARDAGINQPGAAGNAGPGGPGKDPGVNQPGRAGNKRAGAAKDPGINQPGAAGNVGGAGPGKDPGVNQPGAAGNRGGPGR